MLFKDSEVAKIVIFGSAPSEASSQEENLVEMTVSQNSESSTNRDLLPVSVLVLPTRPANVLKRLGITTVGQLRELTTEELLNAPNCGTTTVSEINQALATLGLDGLVPDRGADEDDEAEK